MLIISYFILDLCRNDDDGGNGICGRRSKSRRELQKDVKYADDQGMETLQTINEALSETGKEYDIKINVKKTKMMRVGRNGSKREGSNSINILIEGRISEPVSFFGITHLR